MTASSGDGRTFSFDAPDEAPYLPGDLVVLRPPGPEAQVGQVTAAGTGLLVAVLDADGSPGRVTSREPYRAAPVEPIGAGELGALQGSAGADLPIGTWTTSGVEVPARLRSQGFGRHTFLCGQSGSGKTYALGVILEQLLLGTDLRMVVFDPNADFVGLGETLPGAPPEDVARLASQEVRVLGATSTGAEPLRHAVRHDAAAGPGRGAAPRPAGRTARSTTCSFSSSATTAPLTSAVSWPGSAPARRRAGRSRNGSRTSASPTGRSSPVPTRRQRRSSPRGPGSPFWTSAGSRTRPSPPR